MKLITDYLDIRWDKHKKKWDTLICICGNVGTGKSNLALHMLEYWNTKLYGKVTAKDIKHMCLTKEDFVEDLSDCKKNEMTIFDEAGELSSRKAMTTFNRDIAIAYQIIRADTLFTVLVLPDIKYLDTYFRNTRVKALFYVYERGKCAVFLKDKLNKLMERNQSRHIFSYKVIRPDIYDNFPIYKGAMLEAYDKKKEQKVKEHRSKLKDIGTGKENVNILKEYRKSCIDRGIEKGIPQNILAYVMDISKQTLWRDKKEITNK